MKRRNITGLGALAAVGALTLAACGTSGGSSPSHGSSSYYGAGMVKVVNPSTHKGGVMTMDMNVTPDSTDPQNTYYAFMWDFVRLYTMQLLTYKSCPGLCGTQLTPDLATGMGTPSDGNRVWTYHIQPDVKFQNGDTVTTSDIKYGIERTFAKSLLPLGPIYYQVLLQDNSYPGPYTDPKKNLMGLSSITTPNPTTIVFHLNQPFADFNYVVAISQSTPVEPKWDSGTHGGANYQLNPESTGPYEFQSYTLNKSLTLVPNPYWKQSTDPQVKQLLSKIVVDMNVNQSTVDQNQLANYAQMDVHGLGVQTAAKARIFSTPSLKADADNPINGFLRFDYIDSKVITNVHCREAIEYAADKTTLQDAYGGPILGGDIATTVMPPTVTGYKNYGDLYDSLSKPSGDVAAAKQQLALCGKPNGFNTSMAYRTDTPGDPASATDLQAALKAVGINLTLLGFPTAKYYGDYAGSPAYMSAHGIGIATGGWGADWPDGYGFLYDISDGNAIVPAGNSNISMINVPAINNLFSQAAAMTSPSQEVAIWPKIDEDIMQGAYILPIVYQKVLLYRNPNVTNVYFDDYYGMYNYAVLGLK
jgi:peptide/nickel transport system substrate-binding protein